MEARGTAIARAAGVSGRFILNGSYHLDGFFDEMFAAKDEVRPHYRALHQQLAEMTPEVFDERRRAADASFLYQGVTFTVYAE